MRRVCSWFAIAIVVCFCSPLFAEDTRIILYPPDHAEIVSTHKVKIKDDLFSISPLPIGIDENTIYIHYPVQLWTYHYDLSQKNDLLKQVIGQEIKCKIENDIKSYELLAFNNEEIFLKRKNNILVVPKNNSFIFSVGGKNLAFYPKMDIQFFSGQKPPKSITLNYIVDSISSDVNYIAKLTGSPDMLNLSCFLQIENKTGLKFDSAMLELHLGQFDFSNQDNNHLLRYSKAKGLATGDGISGQEIQDIFIQKINTPYTLLKYVKMNIPLFTNESVKVHKIYVFPAGYYYSRQKQGGYLDMEFSFKNTLNKPIPAGKIQIFSNNQLLGQSVIPYSPKAKELVLSAGKAIDVMGQKVKMNDVKLSKTSNKESFRITIFNYKSVPIQVKVKDIIYGKNWKIVSNSHPYSKKSVSDIQFNITVPQHATTEIIYEVVRDSAPVNAADSDQ